MSNKELKTLLEGTGIKNDFGEKRDIYLELLRFAGAETCDKRDRRSTDYLMDKKIIMYINDHNPLFQTEWSDYCSADFCELNLSMLQSLHKRFIPAKTKTRTEYVKVEFEHAWEAVKAFEEGEEIGQMLSGGEFSKFNLLDDVITYIDELYRKVEKEIDTIEENGKAIYRLMCELEDKHEIDGYHNSWGELRDEWKEIYKELAIQVGYVAPE